MRIHLIYTAPLQSISKLNLPTLQEAAERSMYTKLKHKPSAGKI